MKINQFNTNAACNIPRVLSLRDPFNQEIIRDADGNTLDIWVYGAHSDAARNAEKERDRKRQSANGNTEELVKIGAEFIAEITQGWSGNIEDDDGPIEFSKKNAAELYADQDWIANQVLNFAFSMGNYDPKRYSKSSAGSGKEPGSTLSRKARKEADTD